MKPKPDPKPKPNTKAVHEARSDRKSATGVSGAPKKGGHGGKFTWSGPSGDELADEDAWFESGAVDPKDPNFVEDEAGDLIKGEQLAKSN